MAQQTFAGLAVLIALTFAFMALHGCASPIQRAENASTMVEALEPAANPAEFHGARIGDDALRARVPSDD